MEPSWTSDLDFFFTQRPVLTSVVFLTLNDDEVPLFFFFFVFFSMVLRSAPNVNVARHSKQALANGRSNHESL